MRNYTFDDLKQAINEMNHKEISEIVINLFLFDKNNFRKNLLLYGCLPEPLSRNYDEKKLRRFSAASKAVSEVLKEIDSELAKNFEKICTKLIVAIYTIAENNKKNIENLEGIDFLDYPFTKQVQMLCTFIESQSIYSIDSVKKNYKDGYITGLEYDIPSQDEQISVADNFEHMIEVTNTLIKFLHYKYKNKIDEGFMVHDHISPYYLPSIEKLLLLTSHRFGLENLWEKIKFNFWDFEVYESQGRGVFYFKPEDSEKLKKERAASLRYRYRDYVYIQEAIHKSKQIMEIDEITYVNLEINMDENPVNIFSVSKEVFGKWNSIMGAYVDVSYNMQKENLGSLIDNIKLGPEKNITIIELLLGSQYLKTLSFIYSDISHKKFDDKDENTFKHLAPVVLISDLVKDFSEKCDVPNEKANKIIEQYIFYPNSSFDIFSQPLIYVGDEHVIFTPQLIGSMNENRIIESHISVWDVDVSKKGIEYENMLRFLIGFVPFLKINPKPITFAAFDGKEVEFDLLGMFEDVLLLIEIKCLKRPFSAKEIKQREEDVLDGVKQANRRELIIRKEWAKIREQANIHLPSMAPEKIIKIVCLNVFDFTGRMENDVYITDFSALSKFFLHSNIKAQTFDTSNSLNNVVVERLWKGNEPTVEDLLVYLQTPVAMKGFYENLEEAPRPLLLLDEEDRGVALMDYTLKENPISVKKIKGNTKKKKMQKKNSGKTLISKKKRNKKRKKK